MITCCLFWNKNKIKKVILKLKYHKITAINQMELSVFLKRSTHVAFDLTNFFLFGNPYDKIRHVLNSLKHLKI